MSAATPGITRSFVSCVRPTATWRSSCGAASSGRISFTVSSWTITLPPLRDRREDILQLAAHFIQQRLSCERADELDEPVRRFLLQREYPGNIRDLKQLVTRMADRHVGSGPIIAADVAEDDRPELEGVAEWPGNGFEMAVHHAVGDGIALKTIRHAAENAAIDAALALENGNVPRAARRLGVTSRALQIRRATQRRAPSA